MRSTSSNIVQKLIRRQHHPKNNNNNNWMIVHRTIFTSKNNMIHNNNNNNNKRTKQHVITKNSTTNYSPKYNNYNANYSIAAAPLGCRQAYPSHNTKLKQLQRAHESANMNRSKQRGRN